MKSMVRISLPLIVVKKKININILFTHTANNKLTFIIFGIISLIYIYFFFERILNLKTARKGVGSTQVMWWVPGLH